MSGGQWEYRQFRLKEILEEVGTDYNVLSRFPKIAGVIRALSSGLMDVIHELDYDISGDSTIVDEEEWEARAMAKLAKALRADPSVGRGLPLWYTCCTREGVRGPYATQVQAWKSLELPSGAAHEPGSYVWPKLSDDD